MVYGLALLLTASAQHQHRLTHAQRVYPLEETCGLRLQLEGLRSHLEFFGAVHITGVSALRLNKGPEPGQSRTRLYSLERLNPGVFLAETKSQQCFTGQFQAQLEQVCGAFAAQGGQGFAHLERVSGGKTQRGFHVGQQRPYITTRFTSNVHHRTGQNFGLLERFHERAATYLHVQHNSMSARRQFFGHDAAGNQRNTLHRGRHVAQSVKQAVCRSQIFTLPYQRQTQRPCLPQKGVLGEFRVPAGNALEFVNGAAGVSQPASAHLGYGEAQRSQHGSEHQTGLVAHPTCGVLVYGVRQAREVEHISTAGHRQG